MTRLHMVYFAWVRERIGTSEEDITLPAQAETVLDILQWLRGQSEGHAAAFIDLSRIRAAADQEHVDLNTSIKGIQELAIFPPVTGG